MRVNDLLEADLVSHLHPGDVVWVKWSGFETKTGIVQRIGRTMIHVKMKDTGDVVAFPPKDVSHSFEELNPDERRIRKQLAIENYDDDANATEGRVVKNSDGTIAAFDRFGHRKDFSADQEVQARQYASSASDPSIFDEGWVQPRTAKEMTTPEVAALKYSMYSDSTIVSMAKKGDFRAKREAAKRGLDIVSESSANKNPKGYGKKPLTKLKPKMKNPVVVDGIGTMEKEQADKHYPQYKQTPTNMYRESFTDYLTS